MTNEEKARAIIGGDCKKENCLECGGIYSAKEGGCVAYQRIMQMAQWKDERIKELEVTLNCRSKYERIYRNEFLNAEKETLINKACEWLRNNMYEGTCEQILSKKPYPFMSDFINEFKQAMKGE